MEVGEMDEASKKVSVSNSNIGHDEVISSLGL